MKYSPTAKKELEYTVAKVGGVLAGLAHAAVRVIEGTRCWQEKKLTDG